MEIKVELLDEKDIDQVNEVHNRFYVSSRTKNQFIWEYIQGPAGKAIYVVAKASDNKIIGTQCVIPLYIINVKGEKILTAKSEDTLVDPSYRGKNIFEKMYSLLFKECEKAGINYIWGFTYAVKPFVKLGFEASFHVSMGLLPLNMIKTSQFLISLNPKNTFTDKIKIFALSSLARLKYLVTSSGNGEIDTYSFTDRTEDDLNSLLLNNLASQKKMFSVFQDKAFLDWRVYSNPYSGKYLQHSLLDSSGKMVGNIIYNIHNGVGYIIQLLFSDQLVEKFRISFIKKTIHHIKGNQVDLIRYWGFTHNESNRNEIIALKSAGVTFIDRGITFVWKDILNKRELKPSDMLLSRMASQGTN